MSRRRSEKKVNAAADLPLGGPFALTEAELRAGWTAPEALASLSIVLSLIALLVFAVWVSGGAS